jgi:hypothetical protein
MVLFTEKAKGNDVWPYGMDWLDSAYSTPYFVAKKRQEEEEKESKKAGAAV